MPARTAEGRSLSAVDIQEAFCERLTAYLERRGAPAFLAGAEAAGLTNLKEHRSVGGMRASIYNAMPDDGVTALIDYMTEFERTKA